VNKLTTTTHIQVPKEFMFTLRLYYDRSAAGGSCTGATAAPAQCPHSPFSSATFGGANPLCPTSSAPVARFYLHFQDQLGAAQPDLIYDIVPGQDAIEMTGNSATLISDYPSVYTASTKTYGWGNGGLNLVSRNIYFYGVLLPTIYQSYVITGYDFVDITNGDPICPLGCNGMPNNGVGSGISCTAAPATPRAKVQVSLWATSVLSACTLYTVPGSQPQAGYP